MKNTGNVKIQYPIKITDDHIDNGIFFRISGIYGELGVGDELTYTRNYKITQEDVNKGSVTNTARAKGTYNYNQVYSNKATATVTLSKPSLSLTKSASPTTYGTVGQTITYTYVVTNTGNVPVTRLMVTDNRTTVFLESTTIEPSKSVSGTATYQISQSDLSAGYVINKAYATGTFNNKPVSSNEVAAKVTATQSTPPDTQIPEFPSMALPVAAIIGLLFISQRRRKDR